MGWIAQNRTAGTSNADFVIDQILSEDHQILAHHTEKRTQFYAAVKTLSSGEVWALVVLMQWRGGYHNFAYKAMDETVGPNVAAAPAKVLDLLTDTTSEYAQQWRQRCRHRIAFASALVDGVTIALPHALTFTNGSTHDRFTYRRGHLYADGIRFHIPDWMSIGGLELTAPGQH